MAKYNTFISVIDKPFICIYINHILINIMFIFFLLINIF